MLGQLKVSAVKPFFSILAQLEDFPEFGIPNPAYACQTECGPGQEITVHFTGRFLDNPQSIDKWRKAFKSDEIRVGFIPVESEELAQLAIDTDKSGRRATFTMRHGLLNVNGISTLPHTTPIRTEDLLPVLYGAAQWYWHVDRTNPHHPFNASVEIQFFRLNNGAEASLNLNQTGVVNIEANTDQVYGIKLVNNSTRHLYPYLFYFDGSGLAIGWCFDT